MATKTRLHKQAKAIFELYQTLPEEAQREIRTLIRQAEENMETDLLTKASFEAWGEEWNAPENSHWDDFFKQKQAS